MATESLLIIDESGNIWNKFVQHADSSILIWRKKNKAQSRNTADYL